MSAYIPLETAAAAVQLTDAASWLVPLIFAVVIGFVIVTAAKNILEWFSNNKKPRETAKAKVTAKRENVRRRSSGTRSRGSISIGPSRYKTTYYVTFELESGERREFKVSGNEYAVLSDGDVGHLTYQGTRYHDFERVGEV
ncbi:MAG: DUF2500 domain-containing protein [Alkalicoccus sp.]|nr:MAG: DUF2500 domain-containing protein [Alkalicoccus sp.]